MDIAAVIRIGIIVKVAVVAQVTCRHIVAGPFAAAPHIDRYLRIRAVFREKFVEPVDVGIEIGIGPGSCHTDLFRVVKFRAVGFVGKPHVVGAIEQFGHIHQVGDAAFDLDIYRRFLRNTAAGGYQNDTVGGTHSVNGSRGCVFKNRNVFDLLDGEVGHGALHAVDEHQRSARIKGRDTANPEIRIVQTRLAGALYNDGSRYLSGEGIGKVTLWNLKIVFRYR